MEIVIKQEAVFLFDWISKYVNVIRLKKGGIAMDSSYKNICNSEIVTDSYYLINYAKENHKAITQLKLQKLMYFIEAYYMNKNSTEQLYDTPFKAWTFGPVALPLYSKYRKFGSNNIVLTEEETEEGDSICEDRKNLIREIFDFFGNYTAMQLVNFTHEKDSPWYDKWQENGERITYGPESDINKLETKKWFKTRFLTEE